MAHTGYTYGATPCWHWSAIMPLYFYLL